MEWYEMIDYDQAKNFTEHGNSPVLAAAYQDYSKSKLQEMLYLTDEQIENVTPEMTVKEIREIRETEQYIETKPAKCITGKSGSGFCGAACKKDCNIRCGWLEECATSHKNIVANETMCVTAKEEVSSEYLEELSHEEIIPAAEIEGQIKISDYEGIVPEGMTIICKEREKEEITPQDVLKEETEKLNEWLSAFEGEELPSFVIRQKIIVEALNKTIIKEPEQPEFQILKNNEQRKQWLKSVQEINFDNLVLPMIAVHKNPDNYPEYCVARIFDMETPTHVVMVKESLQEIMEDIEKYAGMVFFDRRVDDVPSLVGVWV